MIEIEKKMKELQAISKESTSGWDASIAKTDKLDKLMKELTAMAREKKTLVGRQMKFQVADGHAVYLITKQSATSVKLVWIDYCDGYTDRHFGNRGGSMKINEAMAYMRFEDMFQK